MVIPSPQTTPGVVQNHIRSFGFTFTGDQPRAMLYGDTWKYLSENINKILPHTRPAQVREDRVHLVEIAGMQIAEWQRDINTTGRRLTTFSETIEILQRYPEFHEDNVPIYVIGQGWGFKGLTEDEQQMYAYFDNCSGTGQKVYSMHCEVFGSEHQAPEEFAQMRVRVFVVGYWSGK
jgi:hypothetical protein